MISFNLKQRFSLLFSSLFSILLGSVLLIVFTLFADLGREEFQDRLAEKTETTLNLMSEMKGSNYQLLKMLDMNTVNRLYNEKIQIFNDSGRLLYSSIEKTEQHLNQSYLFYLKRHHKLFKRVGDEDIYGTYANIKGNNFFTLVSAEDIHGNIKIRYLERLLWAAFIFGCALVWFLSFYLSRSALQPLDALRNDIKEISYNNLSTRLSLPNSRDEIFALAKSFNVMLERIDLASKRQKEFTGNASHELRTPIARIATQIENLVLEDDITDKIKTTLKSISEDIYQLSDIVTSLLLLSNLDESQVRKNFSRVRIDEIIFDCASTINKNYADFKFHFDIINLSKRETHLEIIGDDTLLKIAITNLLKNAYTYSDNKQVLVVIKQHNKSIQVNFINSGPTPNIEDKSKLFNAFTRGDNAYNKPGNGLGLRIVQRIFSFHEANVYFLTPDDHTNSVEVKFVIP